MGAKRRRRNRERLLETSAYISKADLAMLTALVADAEQLSFLSKLVAYKRY